MAGRRPLTHQEERALIRIARKSDPRTRALVTTALFTGYRGFEVVSLTIGQVWRNGAVVSKIGITPAHRKGRRGHTHWVPVGRELARALEHYLLRRMKEEADTPLAATAPLFVSRKHRKEGGGLRGITRRHAYRIVCAAFARAGIKDDGRLGTHTLRKTFAKKVFALSGNNLIVTRDALGHSSAATTEKYLEVSREDVELAILRGDWTRRPRHAA